MPQYSPMIVCFDKNYLISSIMFYFVANLSRILNHSSAINFAKLNLNELYKFISSLFLATKATFFDAIIKASRFFKYDI